MSFPGAAAVVFVFAVVAMTLMWWHQTHTSNTGFVDVAWTALVGFAGVFYAIVGDGAVAPRVVLATLISLWSLRLSIHLYRRVSREPEDGRYAYMRRHWNGDQRRMFGFFMAQAVLVMVFSLPFVAVASNEVTLWWPIVLAVLVFVVSLGGESLADHQLATWREDPANRGKTCRAGLWRYSRHPNYFFEWLHWFAYVLLAIGGSYWWLALLGPIAMLSTLLWVTGIPFVEAQSLRSRGEDYRRYQQETSMFVPWFPKTAASVAPHSSP